MLGSAKVCCLAVFGLNWYVHESQTVERPLIMAKSQGYFEDSKVRGEGARRDHLSGH